MLRGELRQYLYGIRWEEAIMPLMDFPTCEVSLSPGHLARSRPAQFWVPLAALRDW
jgi:hypothetical protein